LSVPDKLVLIELTSQISVHCTTIDGDSEQ